MRQCPEDLLVIALHRWDLVHGYQAEVDPNLTRPRRNIADRPIRDSADVQRLGTEADPPCDACENIRDLR
jgi:hypothetical protein